MPTDDFCDYLIRQGYATSEQIREARKFQQTTGGDLSEILIGHGVPAMHVYMAKAQSLGVPFVDLSVFRPDPAAISAISADVARRYKVIPLKRDGDILYVAMTDPLDTTVLDALRSASKCSVRGV